ncbi:alpha/beta hydrolase family protein, partial [candidate division KSB1 bacterium]
MDTNNQIQLKVILVILLLINTCFTVTYAQDEDLDILNKWIIWNNPGYMLHNHLNRKAIELLDLRDKEISKLRTRTDWLKRQRKVKDILMKIVGPFPEKTPLNARVTGTVRKDGYRIEKIIYESMPNFFVTGCLFIPDGIKGKRPAILKLIGHTPISFRVAGWYQNVIQNLVKKGFIVFAIDPIGQGERIQYYDPEKKRSKVGYSALEHNYCSDQCFLSGTSSAKYFTWDGIRAIDYLLTRKEVDSERIGVTGLSGGGTITSYMCAFDERIKAGIPCNWSSASRRLIESCGTHDSEANIYHGLLNGITFADLLEQRAPKPTLMVFTTRDYLNIQGAREAYNEIKKAYNAFGKKENLEMSEDDDVHAYTKKNNEAIYAFFQKHLNFPGDPTELKADTLTPAELNITPTGQLSTYIGGENVSTLNKKDSEKLIENLENSRKNIQEHLNKVRIKAKELSGYSSPLFKSDPVFCGRYQRDGYCIEMYVLQTDA